MKKTLHFLPLLSLLFLLNGCEKKDSQRLFDSLSATITPSSGTARNFTATAVDDQESNEISPYPGTRIQLTGDTDNNEYITLSFVFADVVPDTYDITSPLNESNAICAYHAPGASSDDVGVTGSIVATSYETIPLQQSQHKLTGTFDFTTASGTHITGDFVTIL